MATQTASKPIDLKKLEGELIAAGVPIVALTATGGDLDTNALKTIYGINASGARVDLPVGAATVITNHSHTPVNPAALLAAIKSATLPANIRDAVHAYLAATR